MTQVVVAYVPVLHEGYRRFLDAHARGRELFVVGPGLYGDYRPLAKDIRRLDAELVAQAIAAWGICSEVVVLDDGDSAAALAARRPRLTLPAEDVSYQLVERYFAGCAVSYDSVFLRWDKTRTAQLLEPRPARHVDVDADADEALSELIDAAEAQAGRSIDWWRQVGAAIRYRNGDVAVAVNEHLPHPLSAYAVGDPRANFSKGVHLELTTAVHAEARLIAHAARDGLATAGATLYVTDFPCPPCAKLIADAGIARLYYRQGYAVLDGQDVLERAGVQIACVAT
jgi:dCMP deaminase